MTWWIIGAAAAVVLLLLVRTRVTTTRQPPAYQPGHAPTPVDQNAPATVLELLHRTLTNKDYTANAITLMTSGSKAVSRILLCLAVILVVIVGVVVGLAWLLAPTLGPAAAIGGGLVVGGGTVCASRAFWRRFSPTQRSTREHRPAQAGREKAGPAVHRTIIAVDIEDFGDPARTLPHQLGTRAGLYTVVEQALCAAGVLWDHCRVEDRGDAVFLLVPPDVPKESLVDIAPQALARAVRAHNNTSHDRQRFRLRMAVHTGEIAFDNHGATSTAVTTTFRLLDAPPVKQALCRSSGVVALIVSQRVFDDVVRHSAVIDPDMFRPVEVHVKEIHEIAWVALPDQSDPADLTVLDHTTGTTGHPSAAIDPGSHRTQA
ncbi:hypothetical protein [Actinocrispum wychmicini]|uniref:Class 3 adenylate cyclase n=1 Tax=Actinocrispum wychmicini TaxID=1213861 RepID=A0A4R2K942_9PSEU|nr:hypothetical protein [Actinocrispum wychmicini]TCO62915.1 hypothetical protein EV192_1021055 [Actinocrispum wychmicini]